MHSEVIDLMNENTNLKAELQIAITALKHYADPNNNGHEGRRVAMEAIEKIESPNQNVTDRSA